MTVNEASFSLRTYRGISGTLDYLRLLIVVVDSEVLGSQHEIT